MVTQFSSSWEEEYPKGEVVGRKYSFERIISSVLCSLPPRPLGTPPPRRRGMEIVYFKNGNKSSIPNTPSCRAVYSAASTAPSAKPFRFLASWMMEMLSASES